MSFIAPSFAWLLLLAVPLVAFYFLKLRRPMREVGSLALWRQVMNDQRVNSPFQRFKRHLLLFLQLLILLLLVMAAMRPFWGGGKDDVARIALLLDISSSSGAMDKPGGKTRLDEMKDMARDRIKSLRGGQSLCLMVFSATARQITPFTDDKRELNRALDLIETEDLPARLEEGLRLASALARAEPFPVLELLSDGNLVSRLSMELPFSVDYRMVTQAGENLGITGLSARRGPDGNWQLLVEVSASVNRSSEAPPARLDLFNVSGENELPYGERVVNPSPGGSEQVILRLPGKQNYQIRAKLQTSGFDSLDSDNQATIQLPALRPLTVWVPEKDAAVRHAFRSLGDVVIHPSKDVALPGKFDILVSGEEADLAREADYRLFSGLVPGELKGLLTSEAAADSVVDWRRDEAIFQHVQFGDVILLDTWKTIEGIQPNDWVTRGYEPLAFASGAPLFFENKRRSPETGREFFFLVPWERTTLPYRLAFPVLLANIATEARVRNGLSEAEGIRPDHPPVFGLAGDSKVTFQGPGGRKLEATTDKAGLVTGVTLAKAGEWILDQNGKQYRFDLAPLSLEDSKMELTPALDFGEISATATAARPVERSLWPWLIIVALVVLVVEWMWFHRRIRVGASG